MEVQSKMTKLKILYPNNFIPLFLSMGKTNEKPREAL